MQSKYSELITARLIIRRLVPADAAAFFQIRCQPAITQFQDWEPESVEEVSAFIARQIVLDMDAPDTWFQLGITLKDSGQLIGDCGLHFLGENSHQTEIGISLSADQQGKGYATETLTAVFDFLFNILGKQRVFASTDPDNACTIKLLSGLGMRQEAHFLESYWFKSRWADDLIFGILRREWLATHPYHTN